MRAVLIALCLGSPAFAAETFTPPVGCTGTLTVQMKSCLVTNIWTCAADAPGEQWVSIFTQGGPSQVRKVDRDFQWLTTYYATPPTVETMALPAADPSNLDELLSTQHSPYDAGGDTYIDLSPAFTRLAPHLPPKATINPFPAPSTLIYGEASSAFQKYLIMLLS